MKHHINYKKYLLKHLDDSRFQKRSQYLEFDEKKHKYTYNKKSMNGVTSVFGYAQHYYDKTMTMDPEYKDMILRKASKRGIEIHKHMEELVKNDKCTILPKYMKVCLIEQKLMDPEAYLCGTVDVIGYNTKTRKFFVLDWKTSKRSTNNLERFKYGCQLWAYARLFSTNFLPKKAGLKVNEIEKYIVYIDKNTGETSNLSLNKEIWTI